MIVPNTFLRASTYEPLRRELVQHYDICELAEVGPQVFSGVTASTVILVIKKDTPTGTIRITALSMDSVAVETNSLNAHQVMNNASTVFDIYSGTRFVDVSTKIEAEGRPLGDYVHHLISGIQTWKQHKSNFIANTALTDKYKPLLEGKDIGRYELRFQNKFILYDKDVLNVMQDDSIFLLPEKVLIQRVSGGNQPIRATLDTHSYYAFNSINTLVCRGLENRYVLGILNSRLINWYYANKFSNRSTLTVNIANKLLRQLPIHPIDFSETEQVGKYNTLVSYVTRMLDLHQRLAEKGALHDAEWEAIAREIRETDRAIDELVYDLYGLSAAERRLVEVEVGER